MHFGAYNDNSNPIILQAEQPIRITSMWITRSNTDPGVVSLKHLLKEHIPGNTSLDSGLLLPKGFQFGMFRRQYDILQDGSTMDIEAGSGLIFSAAVDLSCCLYINYHVLS